MRQTPSPRPKYTRPIADDGLVVVSPFVISIESQRFYRGWRYYWAGIVARQTPSPRPKYTRPIADDGLVVVSPFVISIESQRFYRGWRYYWIICAARNPDELVSWGHAPMLELAKMAAENAVMKLESGFPKTSRVTRLRPAPRNEVRSTDRMC